MVHSVSLELERGVEMPFCSLCSLPEPPALSAQDTNSPPGNGISPSSSTLQHNWPLALILLPWTPFLSNQMSPNTNQAGSNTSWSTGPKTHWHSQATWLHPSRNFPIKQLLCWKRYCFDNTEIAGKKPCIFGLFFFFHLLSSQMGNLLKNYCEVLVSFMDV